MAIQNYLDRLARFLYHEVLSLKVFIRLKERQYRLRLA
jgi:hypothetical protein